MFQLSPLSRHHLRVGHSQREVEQANALAAVSRDAATQPKKPPIVGHEKDQISEQPAKPRTLLVISLQPSPTLRAEIATGRQPRRDYWTLQAALGADIVYLRDGRRDGLGRFIVRVLGARPALTWTAFRLRREYDIIYTDTEIVGLPLALLLKLSRAHAGQPRHVTLAHYLSPLKKRIFFHLGVGSHIDSVIVHASAQRGLATDLLHMPHNRVAHVPYFVDTQFWRPMAAPSSSGGPSIGRRQSICAAGLEFRDYPTLIEATENLDVDVHIAASSAPAMLGNIAHSEGAGMRTSSVPANVSIHTGYDYAAMRALYASTQFVIVPLQEVNFQAGVTVILEAMAMGKAVIVSGNRGQTDVVRDRRNGGRGRMPRQWSPSFLDDPGVAGSLGGLPTGFYVTPGDSTELRRAIQYLMDHREVAEELGSNGRCVAESYFSLEAFAQRFAAVIRGDARLASVNAHLGMSKQEPRVIDGV